VKNLHQNKSESLGMSCLLPELGAKLNKYLDSQSLSNRSWIVWTTIRGHWGASIDSRLHYQLSAMLKVI